MRCNSIELWSSLIVSPFFPASLTLPLVAIQPCFLSLENAVVTVVMENLEVLKGVLNFKCDEDVVKRIPNINKWEIRYEGKTGTEHDDYYCMGNIKCLDKLEYLHISLWLDFRGTDLYKLMFPQNLKSLTLSVHNGFEWEMRLEKIGSLPLLEKFKLWLGRFRTGNWEIYEDQFPSLKYLGLFSCESLTYWTTEASSIFPLLETLYLFSLDGLENSHLKLDTYQHSKAYKRLIVASHW